MNACESVSTCLLLLMVAAGTAGGFAQDAEPQQERLPPESVIRDFIERERNQETAPAPELPSAVTLQALAEIDSASAATYLTALRSLYSYQSRGFEHRSRLFRWQFVSSIVIFGIVHVLVLTGLYFSWMQFRRGAADGLESELALSHAGFTIRSPVLGLVILVVSLAFFYLYLVHVYPIEEII